MRETGLWGLCVPLHVRASERQTPERLVKYGETRERHDGFLGRNFEGRGRIVRWEEEDIV